MTRTANILLRAGLLPAIICLWPRPTAAGGPATVYFRVAYANGEVRDAGRVPTDARGILGVVRISQTKARPGARIVVSTEGKPMQRIGHGRTSRVTLRWNGMAWIGPPPPKAAAPPPAAASDKAPASRPAAAATPSQREEIRKLEMTADALRRALADYDMAVVEAREKAADARGTAAEKSAAAELAKALQSRSRCQGALGNWGA